MTVLEEAERAGIDLSLIDVSLGYSYDKRAEQHQAALELALELESAAEELRAIAESSGRHKRACPRPTITRIAFLLAPSFQAHAADPCIMRALRGGNHDTSGSPHQRPHR